MRVFTVIIGIIVAAIGGVIAYRSYFFQYGTSYVVTSEGVDTVSSTIWVVAGLFLFFIGVLTATLAATRARHYTREHTNHRPPND